MGNPPPLNPTTQFVFWQSGIRGRSAMAQQSQQQKHYNGLRLIKNEKQALRKRGRRVTHKQ